MGKIQGGLYRWSYPGLVDRFMRNTARPLSWASGKIQQRRRHSRPDSEESVTRLRCFQPPGAGGRGIPAPVARFRSDSRAFADDDRRTFGKQG